jgi:hypothetical protein
MGLSAAKLSVIALLLGVCGAVAVGFLIASEANNRDLRWRLILLPVVLVSLPVFIRTRPVRVLSAVAMTGWAALGTFSIGPLFLPCVIAMWAAAYASDSTLRERPS